MKIADMQVRGAPRSLFPGDPVCSTEPVVIVEALTSLLRMLHCHDGWSTQINKALLTRLGSLEQLASLLVEFDVKNDEEIVDEEESKTLEAQGEVEEEKFGE